MTTITLKVPDNKTETVFSFLKELPFGKVEKVPKEKEKIFNSIKQGLKEVRLIKEGKVKAITLEQMYKELENE
jgi:hypothetical protein